MADLYETSQGPLFVAVIEGRYEDWGTDVRPRPLADEQDHPPDALEQPEPGDLWPIPAELTCALLADGEPPPLRVKCRDHGRRCRNPPSGRRRSTVFP